MSAHSNTLALLNQRVCVRHVQYKSEMLSTWVLLTESEEKPEFGLVFIASMTLAYLHLSLALSVCVCDE